MKKQIKKKKFNVKRLAAIFMLIAMIASYLSLCFMYF